MITKYIRLLSYDEACKVIDFVNENSKHYAYITMGGVGVQTEDWADLEKYIQTFTKRYNISSEHPYKTEQRIVSNLKNCFEM